MSLSLLLVLVLAGVWCLLVGEVTPGQISLGLGFGALVVFLTGLGQGQRIRLRELPRRVLYLGVYLFVLVPFGIVQSNLDLARRLLRPTPGVRPGIVRVRLESASEATAALVGHAITISPGEMVVDYSEDGRTIYVHVVDISHVETRRADFWRIYRRVLQKVFA